MCRLSLSSYLHLWWMWNMLNGSTFAHDTMQPGPATTIRGESLCVNSRNRFPCEFWVIASNCEHQKQRTRTEKVEQLPTLWFRFTCPSVFKCHRNLSAKRFSHDRFSSHLERIQQARITNGFKRGVWTWRRAQSLASSMRINTLWLPPRARRENMESRHRSLIKTAHSTKITVNWNRFQFAKWGKNGWALLPFVEHSNVLQNVIPLWKWKTIEPAEKELETFTNSRSLR